MPIYSIVLPEILLLLAAAVVVVVIFRRLNLSPVLGYFVAGAMIGTYGLEVISVEDTKMLAEFGVVFLLFMIGLELTFERLVAMRYVIFGVGTAQVLLTALAIGGGVYWLGKNGSTALIIGGGLALSSTAIVLQVLAEQRREATQVGRLSLAILLLQDFAVVPLLVLIPLLSQHSSTIMEAMGVAFLKAIGVLCGIFIAGRLLLRPFFAVISSANPAKTNELFVATTLLIALGGAWLTEHWGLSLALGAFTAGLLVAETEFKHQVEESITPFKGLFLGLFFMTVGMSINISAILEHLSLILLLSVALILVKALLITGICMLFRFSLGNALHAGLLLSQGGEFAFVLFRLAGEHKLIDTHLEQILLLVVTCTMALTPLLSLVGSWAAERLKPKHRMAITEVQKEASDLEHHVVIAGFGRVGKMVAKLLAEEDVHYIAIDASTSRVREGQEEGFSVYRGDATKKDILDAVGVERADTVIITIENEAILKKVLHMVHAHYPDMTIIVRVKDLSEAEELMSKGATLVVPETYETGLQLGGAVLRSIGVSGEEISRLKNRFRAGEYMRAKEME